MSGARPPARGVQPAVSLLDGRIATQGMIGPNEFVQPSGDLTAVSFRFLNSLFLQIQELQRRLTAAGIP